MAKKYKQVIKEANEKKKKFSKLRTAVVFGGFALLLLCAVVILLVTGLKNVLTPFSFPASTLSQVQTETAFLENFHLTTKLVVPGTSYSLYVPDGSFSGDETCFYDSYNGVTYAITYSDVSAREWVIGGLNRGVLNFYSEGKDTVFANYISDIGYLNGYQLCYYAGVATTTALGKEEEVYSVTYELELPGGKFLLLSAATLNKHSLAEGKAILDAMVYTLAWEDEAVLEPDVSIDGTEVIEETESSVVNEDGFSDEEVDGVYYEYLNMQDQVVHEKGWTEEVNEDGTYTYSYPYTITIEQPGDYYIEILRRIDGYGRVPCLENNITVFREDGTSFEQPIDSFVSEFNTYFFEIHIDEPGEYQFVYYELTETRNTDILLYVYDIEAWQKYLNVYPEDVM